jgi:enoyl-CoA hydratase/carnithine racemase
MGVSLTREGGVGVITLDRPPANSYDADFLRELASAIDDARLDDDVRAVVLASASEKFFCAGADVKAFAAGTPRRRSMTALLGHEAIRKMETTPLLFIAVISGHALGGGLEIALGADLRFASEGTYQLGLVETNLGLFPGNGGTQRLPRIVGLSRGIDMIVGATAIGPGEARELGIVDRLLPNPDACRDAAMDYARRVAAGPSEAIGRAKLAATQGYGAPLDLGLAIEREAISRVFVSEDAEEGIAAFGEKRKPAFRGR